MDEQVNDIFPYEEMPGLFPLIDTAPIESSLKQLGTIKLQLISGTSYESLWDYVVRKHHYLGHKKIVGRRLKYLAFVGDRPIAAIGWRSASLRLEARDFYIGWSREQREKYLRNVVNNNRFLIFNWVRVPHLASHILSQNIRVISNDWKEKYGHPVFLLETFVDPERYKGICYKASNWECIGMTKGFTKKGVIYEYHGSKKEVFVYVLEKDFRKIINCQKKPYPRKSPQKLRMKRLLQMMIQKHDYDPNLIQWADIRPESIRQLGEAMVSFHSDFHDCHYRIEQYALGQCYLKGLLSDLERKNIEAIALRYLEPNKNDVRSLQKFMTDYNWQEELMILKIQRKLSELIASKEGMITVDSSECPKKGNESVGVARQYCGNTGKIDNCQSGVFVGYTGSGGYGLLDRQLYMPEIWFSTEYAERRSKCKVPEDLTFKTKIEIAFELIEKVMQTNLFPAKWIGADATFGSDSKFRDKVDTAGKYYFVNIRSDTLVWLKRPEVGIPDYCGRGRVPQKEKALESPINVSKLAASSDLNYEPVILAEGAKGPIFAQVCKVRIVEYKDGLPGKELWLFIRKDPDGKTRYAFSNAPDDIPIEEMKRAATMRWPIEQCFEDGKKHLGMDHYELRSWKGWHRHMTYVFLAHLFLLKIRIEGLKKFHR